MKILFRIVLPLISSIYLATVGGRLLHTSISRYIFLGVILMWLFNNFLNLFFVKYIDKKHLNERVLLVSVLLALLTIGTSHQQLVPVMEKGAVLNFSVTPLGTKNPASHSIEVWITAISSGGNMLDLTNMPVSDGWARKEKYIFYAGQKPGALALSIDNPADPSITFLKHDWSGQLVISGAGVHDTIDLFKPLPQEYYTYDLKKMAPEIRHHTGLVDIAYWLLAFLFWTLLFYVIFVYVRAGRIHYGICAVVISLILFFLPSHLTLSWFQRVPLVLVSFLAGWLFTRAVAAGLLKGLSKWHMLLLGAITLYAGFGCVGNTIFMYGNPGIRKLAFYCLFCIWFFLIEVAFLYITYRLKMKVVAHGAIVPTAPGRLASWRRWGMYFLIFATVGGIYLYAFYPAVMSSDSLSQWGQATGLYGLDDWHPVFHTLYNKCWTLLYKSPASIAAGQIVFMAAVVASFQSFLEDQGIPRRWVLWFAVLFALMPQNGINEVTLWKDIDFTVSLLWLTLIVAKIITYPDYLLSWRGGLELVLSLVAVALFRHNGLLVYAIVAVGLSFYFFRKKARHRSGFAYIGVSLVLVLLYSFVVLGRKEVNPNPAAIKFVAPIHGIADIMSNDAELPAGVRERMLTILPDSIWLHSFSPYSAEDYQFKTNRVFINNLSGLKMGEFVQMYTSSFFKHPYIITRDRLYGVDFIWDLTQPVEAYNSRYNTELEPNDFGLSQTGNVKVRDFLKEYLALSVDWGGIFIWRTGIYTIFLLCSMFFVVVWCNEKKAILIFSPWVACILSLVPAMVLQDFRYVYFIFFLSGFLWLLVLSNVVKGKA